MANKIKTLDTSIESARGIKARFQFSVKQFATETFTFDIDLTIPGQGVTALFGESGSGKTSLLRCIA
jgi:molybdate transport system ATP-binding protein